MKLRSNWRVQEEEECDFGDIRQLDHTCLNHFWDRQNRYRFLQFGFEVRFQADG